MFAFFQSFLGSFMASKVLAALGGVLALILADFVLGVLVSMRSGTFDVRKLPQFLETSFVPYAGGLLILALFSSTDQALEVLFFAISAAVYAKFLADIKDKIAQLFAGISIQSTKSAEPQNALSQAVIVNNSVVAPVPDVTANTASSTEPKSIVDVVANTLDQVGEQAKTQARDNLTAKIATVVQEATQPSSTPPVA